jgi:hypothetical protein
LSFHRKMTTDMIEKTTMNIIFTCINIKCGEKNNFSIELSAGHAVKGARSVLRKCAICGFDNVVSLPDNWKLPPNDGILRGG